MGRGAAASDLVQGEIRDRNHQWASDEHNVAIMPRGLPRPLHDGMPVPYSSDVSTSPQLSVKVSVIDPVRNSECTKQGLCLLCGEKVEKSAVVLVDMSEDGGVIDNAPLHSRCAKLTARHCPHILKLHQEGMLGCFGARAPLVHQAARRGYDFHKPIRGFRNVTKSVLGPAPTAA